MLFNSPEFFFVFLPAVLMGFYLIRRLNKPILSVILLVCASLIFYGYWSTSYLVLIGGSIIVNYGLGFLIAGNKSRGSLALGVIFNLALIAYFKYAGFLVANLNLLIADKVNLAEVVLPLAISFFTFQQIAYLVDCYKTQSNEKNFFHYALFVSFFPQLIAGPIVHHAEVMPQFKEQKSNEERWHLAAMGIIIFSTGLFKKVAIADTLSTFAKPVFAAAEAGTQPHFFEAWAGALAYSLQIFFDFSGYSDMAIGIGLCFGIRLPINFWSPYKSINIIEFWRTWHITLSKFLKDYLYIPLGGNRKGNVRRYVNLFVTMLLGGLWHGAAYTFVIWGSYHGLLLIINHGWLKIRSTLNIKSFMGSRLLAQLVTYFAVVFGWVVFRAETFVGAKNMLGSMVGANGILLPKAVNTKLAPFLPSFIYVEYEATMHWLGSLKFDVFLWVVPFTIFALFAPNIYQLLNNAKLKLALPQPSNLFKLKPNWLTAIIFASLTVSAILLFQRTSEFLYFQF